METLYNVYFAGQVQDGQQLDAVKAKLAKLFNADEQTLEKLFSGKAQLLKRNCDKATAVKYKTAIEKAGGVPVVKAVTDAIAPAPDNAKNAQASQSSPTEKTASEKIAALAAAAEGGTMAVSNASANTPAKTPAKTPTSKPTPTDEADGSGIVLAPEGTEVLRESERTPFVEKNIDTSALSVDAPAERLAPEAPPAPDAPDTTHLDMGEVGETIPTLPSDLTPVSPNTDAISLSPEGADFSDCAAPEPAELNLDLSALDVAPEGSAVLEEQYRKRETAEAPSTDHISLDS